jgi:hypothetical protein
MFDVGKYDETIKLLDHWLSVPSCPHVFRVSYMVLLACCLDDWKYKYANLDRADKLCANLRHTTLVGTNEKVDEILADLRMDIDTTRRLFDKELAESQTDEPDDDAVDAEMEEEDDDDETGEDSDTSDDAAERLAKARKGKAKATDVTSSAR